MELSHYISEAFPYFVALSPLLAGLVALLHALGKAMFANPIAGPLMNTSLVLLESTKSVWNPVITRAIAAIKPIIRALILFARSTGRMILSVKNTILSVFTWVKANSADASYIVREFGHSLFTIGKTIAKGLYYISKALSIVIVSLEQSKAFLGQVFMDPSALTWDTLRVNAFSLAVSASVVGMILWSCFPKRKEKTQKSSAVGRRRAFLHSEDAMKAE